MKRITALILAVILLCLFAACGKNEEKNSENGKENNTIQATNDDFYHGYISSHPSVITKTSFGTYLCDIVNLDYVENGIDRSVEEDHNKLLWCSENGEYISDKAGLVGAAQDGNDFYGWSRYYSFGDLYHFVVTDEHTATREIWIDKETLINSCLTVRDYPPTLYNLLADGDNIYATISYNSEYMDSQVAINGRIACLSKNGDKIGFVGDDSVRAVEFVVKDGWIYYVDNGYTVKDNSYTYDDSKIGIYKIKTDGSEKTLLYSGKGSENYYLNRGNAGALSLYENDLYFLDLSDGTNSYPARIKTDGTGYEKLSQTSAVCYTLDPQNQILYYGTGKLGKQTKDTTSIKQLSIDTRQEKSIGETSIYLDEMSACDNYLYYYDLGLIPSLYCYRIDPKTGETKQLEEKIKTEAYWVKDSDGKPKRIPETTVIQWSDVE